MAVSSRHPSTPFMPSPPSPPTPSTASSSPRTRPWLRPTSATWFEVRISPGLLGIQERLTAQIANTIEHVLKPMGIGVVIKATHHCMTTRGINKQGTDLVTSRMLGCFRENPMTRQEFLSMVHSNHDQ